jgi:hypothetical protein
VTAQLLWRQCGFVCDYSQQRNSQHLAPSILRQFKRWFRDVSNIMFPQYYFNRPNPRPAHSNCGQRPHSTDSCTAGRSVWDPRPEVWIPVMSAVVTPCGHPFLLLLICTLAAANEGLIAIFSLCTGTKWRPDSNIVSVFRYLRTSIYALTTSVALIGREIVSCEREAPHSSLFGVPISGQTPSHDKNFGLFVL